MTKSAVDLWIRFATAVVPVEAGFVQREEMRRAFYAGLYEAMREVVVSGGGLADLHRLGEEAADWMRADIAASVRRESAGR